MASALCIQIGSSTRFQSVCNTSMVVPFAEFNMRFGPCCNHNPLVSLFIHRLAVDIVAVKMAGDLSPDTIAADNSRLIELCIEDGGPQHKHILLV